MLRKLLHHSPFLQGLLRNTLELSSSSSEDKVWGLPPTLMILCLFSPDPTCPTPHVFLCQTLDALWPCVKTTFGKTHGQFHGSGRPLDKKIESCTVPNSFSSKELPYRHNAIITFDSAIITNVGCPSATVSMELSPWNCQFHVSGRKSTKKS